MKEFRGRVAVVTGADSGIGHALAERCVKEGMRVVLADVETSALATVENEFRSKGAEVLGVVVDVSRSQDVDRLAQQTVETYGAVHLLFNNAGVVGANWIWRYTLGDWQWILGVNLWGAIHGVRAFVPIMLAQGCDCHIMNIASEAGLLPTAGLGAYSVSKHGVVALSEVLRHELAEIGARVGVSVLCPGPVSTRILQAERNRPAGLPKAETSCERGPFDTDTGRKYLEYMRKVSLEPTKVAELAFNGLREGTFYILTHDDSTRAIQLRMDDFLHERGPRSAMALLSQ